MDKTIIGRVGEKTIPETILNYQSDIREQELTAMKNIRNKFAAQEYNPKPFIMFKDYYLIMGIGKDATSEEIEQAYKNADARLNIRGYTSREFHDIQEAYSILSKPELKILYDKELEVYNESDDFANYVITDPKLAEVLGSLQRDKQRNKTSRISPNVTSGCVWTFILILIWMLSTCFRMIMRQRNQKIRNSYSYVTPQKTNESCLQIITIY